MSTYHAAEKHNSQYAGPDFSADAEETGHYPRFWDEPPITTNLVGAQSSTFEEDDQMTEFMSEDGGEQYQSELAPNSESFNMSHVLPGTPGGPSTRPRTRDHRYPRQQLAAGGSSNSRPWPHTANSPLDRRGARTSADAKTTRLSGPTKTVAAASAEQQGRHRGGGRRSTTHGSAAGHGHGHGHGHGGAPSTRTHYDVEKRYRANLNDKFDELRDCLISARACLSEDYRPDNQPGGGPEGQLRMSRVQVLVEAVDYIRHLEESNDWASEYIEKFKAEQSQARNC